MKVNQDYLRALRAGIWIDKHTYRKQNESGVVLALCLLGVAFIVVLAVIFR